MGDRSRGDARGADSREPDSDAEAAGTGAAAAEDTVILPLGSDISVELGGGKAANLARLVRAGFFVPPGFVVTTRAYREHLSVNHLENWILETARAVRIEDSASLEAGSVAIRERFASSI